MACFTINGISISGLGACVPKQEVSNWDYELLSESEKKMLIREFSRF